MLSGPEASLYTLFQRIAAVDQLARSLVERALPAGLTLAQLAVMTELGRDRAVFTPMRLAARLDVTRQTMTTTIRRLERQGLVCVSADPADRRLRRIALTDAGQLTLNGCLGRIGPQIALAVDAVPAETVRSLAGPLSALAEGLAEAVARSSAGHPARSQGPNWRR